MKSSLFVAGALVVALTVTANAQWPQWRGPNRDGVVPKASVPAAWPEKLTPKWKQTVGEGYASPVVGDGRVYVHSRQDPEELVTAFDLATGKPVWTQKYPSAFNKNKYATQVSKGPFSTPLFANGRLYTLGSSAVLTAFDATSGKVLWKKDWSKEIDTSRLFTGTAMSPIITDGLLIVHVGVDDAGAFRAFDPASGAEKWSLPGHGPGYASPIVATFGGTRQIVTMTDKNVVGVQIASGKELWKIPFPDEFNENIVTPVVVGDTLVVSGARKGTLGYKIAKAGTTFTPTQVWQNAEATMYMSSPVVDGNHIYGYSNKRKGQLFCLDATTGKVTWTTEGRAGQNASLQSAGADLVVLTTEGELFVVKRNPAKYEEVRRYKVADGQTWAQPVLLGKEIIVRDATSIAVLTL
jgi:outer membrane protein assembly factor BamB